MVLDQTASHPDVLIIGAGISGINSAYRVQERNPNFSYTILESRHELGGTWSLFKYPGIRSDSDLHTFGFPWDPWEKENPIADAPSILEYMDRMAVKYGIKEHIQFNHKVAKLDWRSEQQRWAVEVVVNGTENKIFWPRYVVMGTGYYDYTRGLNTPIPGLETFKGQIIHPQFWPENFDYTNKNVVIVGSGATAVTILPSMSEKAKHVTMLQRSPGYFIKIPNVIPVDQTIRKWLPAFIALRLVRLRHILQGYLFFHFCRYFPKKATALLKGETAKELPPNVPLDPHFCPSYSPWQQRMCITPSGDFFAALRSGKADVVTDQIETVTETGINLKSGDKLDADIIVTATGLKLQFGGGALIHVDGQPVTFGDKFVWRGAMLQDVPNLFFIFGYTNASWTLGADATAQLFTRMMKDAEKRGVGSFVPTVQEKDTVDEIPMLNLNSTYIKSAIANKTLPKVGNVVPWKPRDNYFQDIWHAKYGDIVTGLQVKPAAAA